MIADPARTGFGPQAVSRLVTTNATCIVLVSCDAVAGARDLRLLIDSDPYPGGSSVRVI